MRGFWNILFKDVPKGTPTVIMSVLIGLGASLVAIGLIGFSLIVAFAIAGAF